MPDILEQLLTRGGQAIGRGATAGAEKAMPILQQLMPLLQKAPGMGFAQRGAELTKQALSPKEKEIFEKVTDKKIKEQAEEFVNLQGPKAAQDLINAQGTPEELESALQTVKSGTTQQQPSAGRPQATAGTNVAQALAGERDKSNAETIVKDNATPTLDTPDKQQNFMQSLGNFLFQAGGVDEEGKVQPAKLLGGLLQTSSKDILRMQQAQALTPGAKSAEAISGAQITNLLEEAKQDRLDKREVLKAQLKAGGTDDVAAGLKILTQDVVNLTEARSAIFGKGRLGGKLSGLAAASPFGLQRDKRAIAESFAESLLFSFGEHIIGQKGRAFVKDEQERVKKNVIGAILNSSDKEFKARMNTILKQANSRLPRNPDGTLKAGVTPIPDIDNLIQQQGVASQAQQRVANIKSITLIEE